MNTYAGFAGRSSWKKRARCMGGSGSASSAVWRHPAPQKLLLETAENDIGAELQRDPQVVKQVHYAVPNLSKTCVCGAQLTANCPAHSSSL